MTNEEAIKELKERYLGMSAYADREQCQRANQALDIAISVLEKQIPKKPTEQGDGINYDCPVCGAYVGYFDAMAWNAMEWETPKYCPECGQALDWSDYE